MGKDTGNRLDVKFIGKPFFKKKSHFIIFNAVLFSVSFSIFILLYLCESVWQCSLWIRIPLYLLIFLLGDGIFEAFKSYNKYKSEFTKKLDDLKKADLGKTCLTVIFWIPNQVGSKNLYTSTNSV